MKKMFGIVVVFVILTVIGFGLWYFTRMSAVPVGDVLPARPLVYIHFSDTGRQWEKFQESSFYSEITKINFNPLVRDNPQMEKIVHGIEALKDRMQDPGIREYVRKFFGQEVVIAVFQDRSEESAESVVLSGDKPQSVWPEVLWVSRVSIDIKFKETLMRAASKDFFSDLNLEKIPYRGQLIYLLPLSDTGITIALTRIGDLLVAAPSRETLYKAIDVYGHIRPALSKDDDFHSSLKTIDISDSIVSAYWDTSGFFSILARLISATGSADAATEEILGNLKGFTVGGASISLHEGLMMRNEMYFRKDGFSGEMKAYLDECRPADNESLKFVPYDVLVYQWIGCLNFKRYWEKIKTEVGRIQKEEAAAETSEDPIRKFENMIGLDIERDVLPVLGSEIGWFANAGTRTVPLLGIKIPQIAIFLRITNSEKADLAMAALFKKIPAPMVRDIVEGGVVQFIQTPLGEAIEPSYTFWGDYLIVGLNRDVLKEALYSAQDKRTALVSAEAFSKLVKSAGSDNRIGIFYLKLGELLERYNALIDTVYKWISAQSQAKQQESQGAVSSSADIDQKLEALQDELTRNQARYAELENEVWTAGSGGAEVTVQEEKQRLGTGIASLQEEIRSAEIQRIEEARKNIPPPKIDQTAAIWRNIIQPVLDALKRVEIIEASTGLLEDRFSTDALIQMDR